MAEQAGKTNQVYVLTGAVAMNDTGAKINGVDNSTFNRLCNLLEIPQFGESYMERLAGMKDSSIDISGNYDPADATGQSVLVPGDSVYIGVYPSGTAVAGTQIPGIVESFEISADATGKQEFSCTVQAIGAPVAMPVQS
jgi:hypothetical protein